MSDHRFRVVEKRKKGKWNRWILFVLLLAALGLGGYFVKVNYSIERIEVSGNVTYSDAKIIEYMTQERYVNNNVVMVVLHWLTGDTYLPFIEKITMSFEQPHVLKVKVKESIRAGMIEYGHKNWYFDESGVALECRNTRFEGVPLVTGVNVKKKMSLGEKVPVDGDYFNTIVLITKQIAIYGLSIDQIHFEEEDDIYLVSGKYQFYIGDTNYLNTKMNKIPEIIKSVSKKSKSGLIDMHLLTDDKNIITFTKLKK